MSTTRPLVTAGPMVRHVSSLSKAGESPGPSAPRIEMETTAASPAVGSSLRNIGLLVRKTRHSMSGRLRRRTRESGGGAPGGWVDRRSGGFRGDRFGRFLRERRDGAGTNFREMMDDVLLLPGEHRRVEERVDAEVRLTPFQK